jgi:hypothetical protein
LRNSNTSMVFTKEGKNMSCTLSLSSTSILKCKNVGATLF